MTDKNIKEHQTHSDLTEEQDLLLNIVGPAMVKAVIPLEAMQLVGLDRFGFSKDMKNGIIEACNEVREAVRILSEYKKKRGL